jgi:serine/alanine adding enzyme
MTPVEIVELEEAGRQADWQAYVQSAPNASMYHALEWRDILLRTFGHRSRYLMALSGRRVCGVLPLIEMRSTMCGHFLVSLPFLNYGGILADTPECQSALASVAVNLAGGRGARHIELRQSFAAGGWAQSGWTLRQHKASLVVPLSADPDVHWRQLSSRLRGKVRKAEKSGATFSAGGVEALDEFYRVFSLNMRNLGTPVYSSEFFRNIVRLAKDATVLMVHRAGRPVAGAIALRRSERMELPWICSDYAQARFNVNEFLYWRAIERACISGTRELDLGRSTIGASTYRFKMQWNPKAYPLFWYYWLAPGYGLPELSPANPKYAPAIALWQKMPIGLANRIGPWIIRNIP